MIRRMLTRYYLLNKRLFRKYSFLLILCIVPLLVGGIRLLSEEESGIARVVLCVTNPEDALASQVAEKLVSEEGVLRYLFCDTEEEAYRMVVENEADTAWIFKEDLAQRLQKAAGRKRIVPLVEVVERRDSISLILSREILGAALYPAFSYAVYEAYVRDELGLDEITEEELRQAYERTLVEGSLFEMAYLDGGQDAEEDFNYLQAPLRGILSVWLVLCGLAACLYYMQDEEEGVFSKIPVARRLPAAFGVCAVVLSDAVLVVLLACKLAGVFTVWHREVISCVLFACATLAFCNLIRLLGNTPESLGSSMLILTAAMLVLCPVFLNLRGFRAVKYLLPSYYYLLSIHNVKYLYGMVIYTTIVSVLCALVFTWKNRAVKSWHTVFRRRTLANERR